MTITLTKNTSGVWSDETPRHLHLPPNINARSIGSVALPPGGALAFVGPNGAGKSRMAGWIDRNNSDVVYIRARRSIAMPNAYAVTPEDDEYMKILAGLRLQRDTTTQNAKNFRYSTDRDGFGDDDYQSVLNILGSKHTTSALKFRASYTSDTPPKNPPASEMDTAIQIWSKVLPHLRIDATNAPNLIISRNSDPSATFEPKEMSDGEKAIFYLVAKSLITPVGSTILVDEPEMYVHRSIRGRLWNAIEQARQDCIFIYFTHDLNFIRTRQYHTVINVRSYDKKGGEKWDYSVFEADPAADEILQISVWGSRQTTLLVEGDRNSMDFKVLSLAFPGIAIEPAGSCSQVINGVAALRRQKRFHHQDVYGVIDADFRDSAERASLSRKGVFCLEFREIENILVSKEVLMRLAKHLGHSQESFQNIYQQIVEILKLRLAPKSEAASIGLAKRRLINLVEDRLTISEKIQKVDEILSNEDLENSITEGNRLARQAIEGELNSLLSLFSVRKDDFGQVFAKALSLKDFETYRNLVLRLAADEHDSAGVLKAIKTRLPSILRS